MDILQIEYEGEAFIVKVHHGRHVMVLLDEWGATIDVQVVQGARYSIRWMGGEATAATPKEAFRTACRSISKIRTRVRREKEDVACAHKELADYVSSLETAE